MSENCAKFQKILENLEEVVTIVDIDGIIKWTSPAALIILGYTPEERIGQSLFEIVHPDDREEIKNDFKRRVLSGHLERKILRLRHKNGHFVYVEAWGKILLDDEDINGIIVVSFDITQEKQERDRLELALCQTSNCIVMTDMNRKITWVNDGYTRLTGYRMQEVIGKNPSILQGKKTDIITKEYMRNCLDSKRGFVTKILNYKKNGEEMWAHLVVDPTLDADGNQIGWIGIHIDITDKVIQEEIIIREKDFANESLENLRVHQVQLKMQNEELMQAQENLDIAKSKYFELYDMAPVGYCTISRTGMIIESNLTFALMLGLTRKDINKTYLSQFIFKEDTNNYYLHHKHLFDGQKLPSIELRLIRKDGTIFWVCIESNIVHNVLSESRVIVSDITQRKQMEQILHDSEEKFFKAFQTSPYAITITNADNGKFVEVNDAFVSMTGISKQTALISTSIGLQLWADENDRQNVINILNSGQKVINKEYQFRVIDNKIITGLFSAQMVEFNQTNHILSSINDITQRKVAEKQLLLTQSRLKASIESTISGLLVVDENRKITDYNRKFLKLWDIPYKIMESNDDIAILHHVSNQLKNPNEFLEKINYLYAHPNEESFDNLEFKDGRTFERYSRPQVISDIPVGRVWSFTDITEHKKRQEELSKAVISSQESNKLKSAFLANMSHEIRTPMNGIISFADLLKDAIGKMDNPQLVEYIDYIIKSGYRLLNLLNDIIDVSKIEADKIDLNFDTYDLNTIIEKEIKMFSPLINDANLKIETEFSSSISAYIDESRLIQIINNLLSNSIKFTPSGGKITIKTGENLNAHYSYIIISDTGIGIDDQLLEKIFEPFYQEPGNAFTRRRDGAGLGLAICKKFVILMHGSIKVCSKKGEGTTVKIYLPRTYEKKIIVPRAVDEYKFLNIEDLKKFNPKILILEDDRINAVSLYYMLKEYGQVVFTYTAQEALEELEFSKDTGFIYDVFLVDIQLSQLWDGFKFKDAVLKLYPNYANSSFIAQTAYAMNNEKAMILSKGFDGYIEKPIIREKLLKIIYDCIIKKSEKSD